MNCLLYTQIMPLRDCVVTAILPKLPNKYFSVFMSKSVDPPSLVVPPVNRKDSLPLVSIVIPVYNRREILFESVESALSQGYGNFEVVISDNCSNDGTWEECVRCYNSDTRVVLVRNSENIGPVPNWLSAVRAARGTYVKILFSDDLLLSGCLEHLVSMLTDDVGFAYSTCIIGENLESALPAYFRPHPLPLDNIKLSSSFGLMLYAFAAGSLIPVSPGAALFRRSDVIASLQNTLDKPPSQECLLTGAGPDVMIFLYVLKRYRFFAHFRAPLVFLRSHPGSFTVGDQRAAVIKGYAETLRLFYSSMPFTYGLIFRLNQFRRLLKKRLSARR